MEESLDIQRLKIALDKEKQDQEHQKNRANTSIEQDKQDLERKKIHMDKALELTDRVHGMSPSKKELLWETFEYFCKKLTEAHTKTEK